MHYQSPEAIATDLAGGTPAGAPNIRIENCIPRATQEPARLRTPLPDGRSITASRAAGRLLSPRRAQLERRYAERDVQPDRALERDRLQREGTAGAADQDVGAAADADVDVTGNADIFAGEGAGGRTEGSSEHGPGQHAARAETDVEADAVDGAVIGLGRFRLIGSEAALHRLVAADDEADARIEPAIERADLKPWCARLGGSGTDRPCQQCEDYQSRPLRIMVTILPSFRSTGVERLNSAGLSIPWLLDRPLE
jgi:hypothetical protein